MAWKTMGPATSISTAPWIGSSLLVFESTASCDATQGLGFVGLAKNGEVP